MSIGTQTTYWNFIQKHGISIPVIQRDYAQGREGKEVLRSKLLGSIKDSLNDNGKSLVLDFVYGMKDAEGRINPLDGQQRLTTLWLLHWYLLLKSSNNPLTDIEKENLKVLSKFTYETRISSRKFCECLCEENNFAALRKSQEDIRKEIEKQTWFMGEWKQDPTVKAMLNMLGGTNGIQKKINENHQKYWSKLTGANCPITFYYLSLDSEIAQTPDDIYIKMNARGEHLTDFENFKADLIKYVRDNKDNKDKWKSIFDNQENPELELSRLIDTDWTDIFWSQLSVEENTDNGTEREAPNVDKQFFAFLNRYFLNCIFSSYDNEKNIQGNAEADAFYQYAYGKEGKADTELKYTDFSLYEKAGVITPDNINALKQIFDAIKGNLGAINNNSRPYWENNSTFSIFPCYDGEKGKKDEKVLRSITQKERVAFFGVCCYLENCNNNEEFKFNENSFKEWMRFVWNMARNSDVETVDSMIKVIRKINKIKEIKEHTHNIIDYLKDQDRDNELKTYFERQWDEEIWKAKKYESKKDDINKAEKLFHGSIRFLLSNDDNNLLNVDKAFKLIYSQTAGEYKKDWFLEILPYMEQDFSKDVDKKLAFYEKTKDVEKIINRDNDIVLAVQEYLRMEPQKKDVDETSWMYPLVMIKDKNSLSLFDYSNSKQIKKYQVDSIYLYKTNNWKQGQCILLQSDTGDIKNNLINRNKFIVGKISEGYALAIDKMKADDKTPIEDDKYLGRTIILEGNEDVLYCGVNGYWSENDKEQRSYIIGCTN